MSLLASIDFSAFVHAFVFVSHSVAAVALSITHTVAPLYHASTIEG